MSALAVVVIVIVVVAAAASVVIAFVWWRGTFALPGLVVGSGDLVTEEPEYIDFTAVEVGWAFDVEITQSSTYSVTITLDDNLREYLRVSMDDGTLMVGLTCCYVYQAVTNDVVITMPELYRLEFSGATHGSVAGFDTTHDLVVELSGASSLSGGYTTSGNAAFDISGASRLELEGEASDLVAEVSGASRLELATFPVADAALDVSGASYASVNLNGTLDADVSGASTLLYRGGPTLGNIDVSGGSTFRQEE